MSRGEYTAKVSPKNEALLTHLSSQFKDSAHILFMNYRGLSVKNTELLRDALAKEQATMVVVKNRIVKRAFANLGIDQASLNALVGPTALIYGASDGLSMLKILVDFKKTHQYIEVKGAIVDDAFYDQNQTLVIASLPSRANLLTQLVFILQAPVQKMAQILYTVISKPTIILKQIAKNKK